MSDIPSNESYRVALPEFEGPLDLLLHLCKTHEIEIVNIPIAFITEKYLEYLDVMQTLSVDVAADYLVMAATLAYLKSRELVPTPEPLEVAEEEGEESVLDPREELIRRLLEYQKYKNAAAQLGERPIEGRNIFGRGMEIEGDKGLAPLADHSAWKLIEAFGRLLEKVGPKVTHEVHFDRISISARINQMIDKLEAKAGSFRFDELFDFAVPDAELRGQLVVTLLAILELARLKIIRVLATDDGETLFIAQVEGAALQAARRAKVSSDAESVLDEGEPAPSEEETVIPEGEPVSEGEVIPEGEPVSVGEVIVPEPAREVVIAAVESEPAEPVLEDVVEENEPVSPSDPLMPEYEPVPEDEAIPENEPESERQPANENEDLPDDALVVPEGEPVSDGEIIPEGEVVSDGEVIPDGEIVSPDPLVTTAEPVVAPHEPAPTGESTAETKVTDREESHEET